MHKKRRIAICLKKSTKKSSNKENITNKTVKPKLNLENDNFNKLFFILEEEFFSIQIITLMPFDSFINLLKSKKINYLFIKEESELQKDKIIIFRNEIKIESNRKILFSNKINFNFIPYYLKYGNTEVLKNKEEYEKIIQEHENLEYSLNNLTYQEVLVLLQCKFIKFKSICKHVFMCDENYDNSFLVWIILNSLVKKGYLKKNKNNFYFTVSRQVLVNLAKKYDFNDDLLN